MAALTMEMVKLSPARNNKECLKPFAPDVTKKVRSFHKSMWGYYHETPLVELKNLAAWLGVKGIYVKDESQRFRLKAFKALGSSYAIAAYLAKYYGCELAFDALVSDKVHSKVGDLTFATTTDGNHGRGVAWAAKLLGFKAVIYMPAGASAERVRAIEREGAKVCVTASNYDETVRLLAQDAASNSWVVIQDTAWPGYEEIPLWIMQGYTTMAEEALEQLPVAPTHVFAQAGVGSMAATVQAVVANHAYPHRPHFVIMEAAAANCFYQSFRKGSLCAVTGELNTIMAGLACGEVNPLAWEILKNYAAFSLSCQDEVAALGMRLLGNPKGNDARIVAGESGAVGGGVLGLLERYHNLKTDMGINNDSVLLLFNTEGDTASLSYRDIVWGGKLPIDFRGGRDE